MFFHATLARAFIQSLHLRGDDDFTDRLNYYYTPIMLAVACLLISAKQYGGTPIECWINPHSKESMEQYIESYCWIQNTYWVPMYENIPDDHSTREQKQIGYYQWVPFILIAEALMFSLPCIIWRLMNWQCGINIQNMVSAGVEIRGMMDEEEREKALLSLSNSFLDFLDMQDYNSNINRPMSFFSKIKLSNLLKGQYMTCLYLFIKTIYALNIIIQFVLLNKALKNDEHFFFGIQVLHDLYNGKPWTESGHFPRVTLCDFEVRHLANLNRYTVQCALLINILNEKVFAFFWLWYLILASITIASLIYWMSNCLIGIEKLHYILKFMYIKENTDRKKYLSYNGKKRYKMFDDIFGGKKDISNVKKILPPSSHLLEAFVFDFLHTDGVFVLRLMSNHAGDLIVMNTVINLWKEFQARNWMEFEHFTPRRHETSFIGISNKVAHYAENSHEPSNNNDYSNNKKDIEITIENDNLPNFKQKTTQIKKIIVHNGEQIESGKTSTTSTGNDLYKSTFEEVVPYNL
ncbi:Innexin family-containing protein [Strongyloides ratti]|uniref:Innexin n=1 Tax=Strongyloides ratti TaxID=34506 RepID=A0A090LCA2_STRRB|nr:Innexin family-containing protein [Strongyloides ratti]CEF67431.1 Innexin family-containing protein [Strongyloides ratti]